MSSDDGIFVQLTRDLKLAAQWGSMSSDELPDPEQAKPDELFNNIPEFVIGTFDKAAATEYGYRWHIKVAEALAYIPCSQIIEPGVACILGVGHYGFCAPRKDIKLLGW